MALSYAAIRIIAEDHFREFRKIFSQAGFCDVADRLGFDLGLISISMPF
jgi:hypothetical protein